MKCPRCNQETPTFIDAPPGSAWTKVCKSCGQFLWLQYDREVGLEAPPAGMSPKRARSSRRRYQPTAQQERIAEFAQKLGANVTESDVKKMFEATRMELAMRKQKEE